MYENGLAAGRLTSDQDALLKLLGEGLPIAEAARRLRLSRRTAERRLAEARSALGARTNAQAIVLASGRSLTTAGDRLTERERQVLELVAHGFRDEEIAERLGIARSTVATLLRSSMAKLGVRSRTQAAATLAEKT